MGRHGREESTVKASETGIKHCRSAQPMSLSGQSRHIERAPSTSGSPQTPDVSLRCHEPPIRAKSGQEAAPGSCLGHVRLRPSAAHAAVSKRIVLVKSEFAHQVLIELVPHVEQHLISDVGGQRRP